MVPHHRKETSRPCQKRMALCFEELLIYQKARELANLVYSLTRQDKFQADYSLVNQVRRAAVSVTSNIAEGYERGSKTEFIQFLYIAKGFCGEVRSQLQIAGDQGYLTEKECDDARAICRHLSSMLSNFIKHLQTSTYNGEKRKK